MKTIVLRDLEDDQILDIIDPAIPYILIPNFRPRSVREWWTTDIPLDEKDKLENVEARDLTVDIITDKKTVEKILKRGNFSQLALLQFNQRIPSTLKIEELPPGTTDAILVQNGLVNKIWVNYEYVELSSTNDNYLERIRQRFNDKLA